jgi:hypothetical protein
MLKDYWRKTSSAYLHGVCLILKEVILPLSSVYSALILFEPLV